jgi:hypothetical protein
VAAHWLASIAKHSELRLTYCLLRQACAHPVLRARTPTVSAAVTLIVVQRGSSYRGLWKVETKPEDSEF